MPDEQTLPADPSILPMQKRVGAALGLYVADGDTFITRKIERIELGADGIPGDRHGGILRGADARTPWHRRGARIFNDRQISLVSQEELVAIAEGLGIAAIEAETLGANVLVGGIAQFSMLPRGTRMFFPSGATLVLTDQNAPCRISGAALAARYPDEPRLAFRFVEVARRMRGMVAYVERPGVLTAGDAIEFRIPEQWLWRD
jgi:hypothetical protein